jgi:hypothetical protein
MGVSPMSLTAVPAVSLLLLVMYQVNKRGRNKGKTTDTGKMPV